VEKPIGAMLCQDFIHDAIESGSGFFQHGHTYLGHPIACAAAGAVLTRIVDDGLGVGVAGKGAMLRDKLQASLGQHPHVGDIRGRGLFIGLEMVADRQTKAPFAPTRGIAASIKKHAMQAGLICYPAQGTIDGRHGDHVLLAPPFIIAEAEMDLLVERLGHAITEAVG
jgi:adenosylmethionine-8-amino-7-oxononanoate aminotransferase